MRSKVKLVQCAIMSLFVLIICNIKTFAQDIDKYITENKKEYKINDTAAILNVFSKEVLDSTKLFIVGENHDVYYNDSIKFSLFKNLYYHANVRIIFEEQPLSFIYFIQNYIETGNDSEIKEICLKQKSSNLSEIYIPYREFYCSLPDSGKFKLIGIDFDFGDWFTIYFLYDIFKNIDIPNELSDVVNTINGFYNSEELPSPKQLINFIELTRESLVKYDFLYRKLLNEKYSLFIGAVDGIDVFIKSPKKDLNEYRKPYLAREQLMFRNIDAFIKKHPNGKFFAQFGSVHISKMKGNWLKMKNLESLTFMLNTRNTIVSNKITAMDIHYIVSKIDYNGYNYGSLLTKAQRNALNRQYGHVYMLKIDTPESPFKEYSGYIDYLIIDNVSKYYYYNLN